VFAVQREVQKIVFSIKKFIMKNQILPHSRWLSGLFLILFLTNCAQSAPEKEKNEISDSTIHKNESVAASADPETQETEQAVKEAEKRVNEKEKRETN